MRRLEDLLPGVLAKQPGRQRLTEMRVALAFRELIGEPLASSCEVIHVRGGTLAVMTSNPALAHQLRLDSGAVLEQLNALRLGAHLRVLQVRTGRPNFLGDGP